MEEPREMMGFGSQEEWERFNNRFPVFVQKYAALESVRDRVFQRGGVGDKLQRLIFGLGRVCSEDFQQALVLCGNGFGIGALQMLRGMYERQVTAAYLIKHPDKVDDFLDYHFVQERKGMNHLKRVYKAEDLVNLIPAERQEEIENEYQAIIQNGRFIETLCEPCNKTRPMGSWSALATPDLALKADRGLAESYFYHYFRPTMFSHSTVYSVLARLREDNQGNPIFDNEGQRKHIKEALVGAHYLLLMVLDMHNDYFELGLEKEIQGLLDDYFECWKDAAIPNEVVGEDPKGADALPGESQRP
jgi:hypothetical protein